MLEYLRPQNSGKLLHGVVFVGSTDGDEAVAVEFDVPLVAVGAARSVPSSSVNVCEGREVEVSEAPVALLAMLISIPKIVAEPRVVVRVVEPLVIVETE